MNILVVTHKGEWRRTMSETNGKDEVVEKLDQIIDTIADLQEQISDICEKLDDMDNDYGRGYSVEVGES